MSAFICQISGTDWEKSKKIGLYGNREKKPDYSKDLRIIDKMSIVRDLIAIKPGDIVFFHIVRTDEGESRIHGIYQAESQAFYDQKKVWDNKKETFPFRFCFKPHVEFLNFTNRDSYIFVSDLYKKIESRDIWSIATLENERNMERRAVRKISIEDAQEIIKLIVKHPRFKESSEIQYEFDTAPLDLIPLEKKIVKIETIENSIKAFLLSELKNNSNFIHTLFGNVIDYMNETFLAQTTRKLFDLLVISSDNNKGKDFYIVEAKVSNYTKNNLSQLLNYIDLFRLKSIFDNTKDRVIGYALAQNYSDSLIELVATLKYFQIFENIDLLKYIPANKKDNTIIEKVQATKLSINKELVLINSIPNNFDELNLYSGARFKIQQVKDNDLKIVQIFFKESFKQNYTLLKEYIVFNKETISCDDLKNIFQSLNQYVFNKKNNDYSECSLFLKFDKIEKPAYQMIEEYNILLKRPNILLSQMDKEQNIS